jgi:assimilatory nitrate reductase catalytic subunit
MIQRGEIRGLLSLCFNPLVSLPDAAYTRAALERLDLFATIDFFLSETAQHADLVLPGSLQEEDGTSPAKGTGAAHCAASRRQEARRDWEIIW